ncbi:MAG TPA: tRNA (guanosine(37)-N1)-methyltransferase TrmD [Candidatus Moranbacteria bacterium]|nr:tRNA (guanosine(37)-N1)-methyltransferase TrmD [Candidatus Moranbacteria bacterium]
MMKFDIVTIFPGIFDSYFSESIIKRAKNGNFIDIKIHNLRDFTHDNHKTVDDTPYGGGAGMVMKIEPIYDCLKYVESNLKIQKSKTRIILFSAKGKRYTQEDAKRLSHYENLILLCGRYEGVDERVAENLIDEEVSIGDFVLTGGEIPAMVIVDSITRLIPGVLGNVQSIEIESHSSEGYLEYPQYTKPDKFMDWKVPEVLLSGDHEKIAQWRKDNSKK